MAHKRAHRHAVDPAQAYLAILTGMPGVLQKRLELLEIGQIIGQGVFRGVFFHRQVLLELFDIGLQIFGPEKGGEFL